MSEVKRYKLSDWSKPADAPILEYILASDYDAALTEIERLKAALHRTLALTKSYAAEREAALAEIERLNGFSAWATNARTVAMFERERQRDAEIERLRAALLKYGWHKLDCPRYANAVPCTCGYSAAMRGEEGK